MDTPRFRFGSGSRPVASTSQPIRRNGESSSSTGVNDLLGKLRLEQGRHRRNLLQRQIKANETIRQDEADYETVNQVVVDRSVLYSPSELLAVPPSASGSSFSNVGRRRTPGPRAPESWKHLAPSTSSRPNPASTSQDLSDYGNGRKWSAERRSQVYSLWAERVLKKRLNLDETILPSGLQLWTEPKPGEEDRPQPEDEGASGKGVRSLVSHCLSVLAHHLDPVLPDDLYTNGVKESSWLTTDEGKMTLRQRLRVPMMVHAAFAGSSGWNGMFELFEPSRSVTRDTGWKTDDEEDGQDWDDSGPEEDEDNPGSEFAAEGLPVLDLSFVPLPSTARRRFREICGDALNLSTLTSLSFAGCGLAMEDIVELLTRKQGGRGQAGKANGLLGLRLKDLSLAGVGARTEDGLIQALKRISTSFTALEFLDLSYMRSFSAETGNETGMLALCTLFTKPPYTDAMEREGLAPDDRPRLPALSVLGFRENIPHMRVTIPVKDYLRDMVIDFGLRRRIVLAKMREIRTGGYVDVILE